MTNETTIDNPAKPCISQCVCKNGQLLIKSVAAGKQPPAKIIHPLNLTGDTRLFAKKGEIVRPFTTVEFDYVQTIEASGITMAIYEEVAIKEFDPSEMQLVAVRSLEQDFEELNATIS